MRYYNTFDEYRAAWNEAPRVNPQIPLNLDIELSAVCNINCPFCFLQNKTYKKKSDTFMDFELAIKIINEASNLGVPALKFNWRGEPTLHPQFSSIIKYARKTKQFHELLINTNGNVPTDAIEGLTFCTKVMFSVDSFNEDIYKKCRTRGNLREVIHIIKLLIDRGHENIWVRRVINEHNKYEDFAKDARKIFKNKVFVAEHYAFERAKDYKIDAGRVYCGYPSQRLTINTSGKVYPCCVDYNQTMMIGDITVQRLKDIWASSAINILRDNLKINNIPNNTQCMNCTSYMAYNSDKRAKVHDQNIK